MIVSLVVAVDMSALFGEAAQALAEAPVKRKMAAIRAIAACGNGRFLCPVARGRLLNRIRAAGIFAYALMAYLSLRHGLSASVKRRFHFRFPDFPHCVRIDVTQTSYESHVPVAVWPFRGSLLSQRWWTFFIANNG